MLWSAALLAAPTGNAPRLSAAVYAAGSLICHQRPERSFHYDGAQYPVCARCLGLYLGALTGVVLWVAVAGLRSAPSPRARWFTAARARTLLIVVAVPTLASVGLGMLGVWDANNVLRAAIAWPLGAAIMVVVAGVGSGDLR